MSVELGFKKTAETRRRRESVTATEFRLVEEVNAKGIAARSTSGGMQIIVTLLQAVQGSYKSRASAPLAPTRERGWGVRGDTSLLINSRNSALDQGLKCLRDLSLCARPLTPNPSPALGRGDRDPSSLSRHEECRHCIL